jgi:hypothetical protein
VNQLQIYLTRTHPYFFSLELVESMPWQPYQEGDALDETETPSLPRGGEGGETFIHRYISISMNEDNMND